MAASFFELDLVAHRLDGFHVRPDESDAGPFQRARKRRILGQEPVARMDGVGASRLGRRHDLVDHEIGLRRGRRADRDGLVGRLDMDRVAVGLGINRDGLDAEPARRPDDAAGDFAPVGDEKLGEHAASAPYC